MPKKAHVIHDIVVGVMDVSKVDYLSSFFPQNVSGREEKIKIDRLNTQIVQLKYKLQNCTCSVLVFSFVI